ncbi:MAG: hypothetical protein KC443_24800, partial [Anaerolineales bacterium]|nr:hypothetical protein [Anaerolineales bacterium]
GARFSPAQKRGELSFTPQEILTIVSRATIANEKEFAACAVDTSDLGEKRQLPIKAFGIAVRHDSPQLKRKYLRYGFSWYAKLASHYLGLLQLVCSVIWLR